MRRFGLWCLPLLLALQMPAMSLSEPAPLAPHRTEYQLARDGLPFAQMTMTLERVGGGTYRYESRTRPHPALALVNMAVEIAPNAHVTEESTGELISGRHRPSHYRFRWHNDKSRELTIKFDWGARRALTNSEGQPWTMEIPDGTLDKLAVLLALRQDLARGQRDLVYTVADGGKLKSYRYREAGRTEITTPAGTWDCVELARSKDGAPVDYRLWLAPDLDYLPVLVERRENGALFRMELTRRQG